jgi:hypothetical protein
MLEILKLSSFAARDEGAAGLPRRKLPLTANQIVHIQRQHIFAS